MRTCGLENASLPSVFVPWGFWQLAFTWLHLEELGTYLPWVVVGTGSLRAAVSPAVSHHGLPSGLGLWHVLVAWCSDLLQVC